MSKTIFMCMGFGCHEEVAGPHVQLCYKCTVDSSTYKFVLGNLPASTYLTAEEAAVAAKKKTVLEEAQDIVDGARRKDYDHPLDNHERIAAMWTIQLGKFLKDGVSIPPRVAALMMIGMKLCREVHRSKRDNGVDIPGYARVVEEIDAEEEARYGESTGSWHRS